MKSVNLYIAVAFLILGSAAQADTVFSGNITLTNSYGNEGIYNTDSFSLPGFNYVTAQTGFFQDLNLEANNVENEIDLFPTNSEVSVYNSTFTLTDVTPATPINGFVTLSGNYQFNLESISLTSSNDLPYAKYVYSGTGELVDTTGVIHSEQATVTIMTGTFDLQNLATDTLTLDIVPESSTWALMAMGLVVVALGRFAVRGQALRI